ncbi:MAG: hypothetical protein RIT81_16870 [Deltaproteobacteria bacterium]
MRIAWLAPLLCVGCYPFESTLCRTCEVGGCESGQACVKGVCVTETERCGLLEYVDGCGEGPPCGDGFECYEDTCRTPVEVAVGRNNSCVRWASGRVSCWGDNRSRQTTAAGFESFTPVEIRDIDDARSIDVGAASVCVVHADDTASCWGGNEVGQLGNSADFTFDNAFVDEDRPRPVGVPEPIADIAIGDLHGCALTRTGRVYCWGTGQDGFLRPCVLGDPDRTPTQLPVSLPQASLGFVAIATNAYDTVGWTASGELYAWGPNTFRQIDSGPDPVCTPRRIPFDDVRLATSNIFNICAVSGDDLVRCFGDRVEAPLATDGYRFGERIVELDSGAESTCARAESGRTWCWGPARQALLPGHDPSLPPVWTPVEIPNADAAAIAVHHHACLIREGDGTFCWGLADVGQVGDGQSRVREPTRVLAGAYVHVEVGRDAVCAIGTDRRLVCWGDDSRGAVGLGHGDPYQRPDDLGLNGVVAVDLGMSHGCALEAGRGVSCWGAYRPRGVAVGADARPRLVPGTEDAVAVATGWYHACALLSDGRVACWGYDAQGQATRTATTVVHRSAQIVAGTAATVHLAAGSDNTCVISADGDFDCWGAFDFQTDFDLPDVVELVGGDRFYCARRSDDTICFGNNHFGRLGDGTDRFRTRPSDPVNDLGATVDIDSFFAHTCAADAEGRVFCWGEDARFNRLGAGRISNARAAVQAQGVPFATTVSVGRNGTCVVAEDGVWCWGADDGGVLTTRPSIVSTPKRVTGLR